jgi:hypothetical protein
MIYIVSPLACDPPGSPLVSEVEVEDIRDLMASFQLHHQVMDVLYLYLTTSSAPR